MTNPPGSQGMPGTVRCTVGQVNSHHLFVERLADIIGELASMLTIYCSGS
jgi:hypothetical protein